MKLLGWMHHKFRRNSCVPLKDFTIENELKKVLGAEDNQEGCDNSSGRNSYFSTKRSSHGSTITLSGKPIEDPDTNGNGVTVSPLLCYLLGSAIELSETTTVAKKEHGTSLWELFQMTNITEVNLSSKYDEEKRTEKEGDKPAVHFMKKATGGHIDSSSAETRLHMISHMFHEKVDPESSTTTYKHENNGDKEDILYDGGHMLADDDIIIYPQRALSKSIQNYKSQWKPPQFALSCNESDGNREYWIKTDAEYLVLEL